MLERHRHTVLPDRVDFVVLVFRASDCRRSSMRRHSAASQSILAAMQSYGLAITYSFYLSAGLRKGVSVRRSITRKKLKLTVGDFEQRCLRCSKSRRAQGFRDESVDIPQYRNEKLEKRRKSGNDDKVSDPFICTHRRGITNGNKPCGKPPGIGGLYQPVAPASHQQSWRSARSDMEDRLRLGAIGAAKNHFQLFVAQRHQVVRPGDPDQAGNIAARIESDLAQPARIDRQHRRNMRAGRVAFKE